MASDIDFIFFDAAGTLIELSEPVGATYARFAEGLGLRRSADEFGSAFAAAWGRMPLREPVAGPRPDDDLAWWREMVGRTVEALPGDGKGVLDEEQYFKLLFNFFGTAGAWRPYAEVPGVLDALRARGFRLGVLSNFDGRLEGILEGHGLAQRFEFAVISSRVGADKPHPEIFRHAVGRAGVAAERCLHVGDQEALDRAAAEAAGLRARRVDRPADDLRSVLADLLGDGA